MKLPCPWCERAIGMNGHVIARHMTPGTQQLARVSCPGGGREVSALYLAKSLVVIL